jgi:hypothetical protein
MTTRLVLVAICAAGLAVAGPGQLREKRLTKQLNLTAEQQNSVHAALVEAKVQRKALGTTSPDLRVQRAAIRATAKSKIYAVLDADQKAQFDRRSARKRRRG